MCVPILSKPTLCINIKLLINPKVSFIYEHYFFPMKFVHRAQYKFKVLPSQRKLIAGLWHNCIVSLLWPRKLGDKIKKMRGKPASGKAVFFLCIACFLAGTLITGQMWTCPSNHESSVLPARHDCDHKRVSTKEKL